MGENGYACFFMVLVISLYNKMKLREKFQSMIKKQRELWWIWREWEKMVSFDLYGSKQEHVIVLLRFWSGRKWFHLLFYGPKSKSMYGVIP